MRTHIDNNGVAVQIDDEIFSLLITDVGERYAKVFYFVRQFTGKSPKEVRSMLDSPSSVIASGDRLEMLHFAMKLEENGAKIKVVLFDEYQSKAEVG